MRALLDVASSDLPKSVSYVVEQIPDGAVLSLGVGGVPVTVA